MGPQLQLRPRRRKTISTATAVTFGCVAFFVLLLFLNGHKNIVRMHGSMQSPVTDMPAGWATVHSTTTVQSATLTVTQAAITGSALTATTTTTASSSAAAVAAAVAGAGAAAEAAGGTAPAATDSSSAHAPSSSSSGGSGISHLLGDLQHSVHAILAAGGWKPGTQLTRAQLAAAAAAAMPDADRDIELHPHKVAAVVGRAKAAQQLARLAQQHALPAAEAAAAAGVAAAGAAAGDEVQTSAETYSGLYGRGGGSVVFAPHADLASCPEGSANPAGASAALVLLAGRSGEALSRSLDGLVALYSRASADVRAAFHLYVGLDSDDGQLRATAAAYAHDTLGAVKLVQHASAGRPGEHVAAAQRHDAAQQQQQQQAATATAARHTAAAAAAAVTGASAAADAAAAAKAPVRQAVARALLANVTQQAAAQQQPAGGAVAPTAVAGNSSSSNSIRRDSSARGVRPDHLRLMLHVFFECFRYPAVLFLEDDLLLAPDFLEFYAATQWLLASDRSLYCLSAWNPQGHAQQQVHPSRLLRTDMHPGRAWLLDQELGLQLLHSWPNGSSSSSFDWQQHLRSDVVRNGRQCIVPEMPRVVPAGEEGTQQQQQGHLHDPAASGKKLVKTGHGMAAAAAAAEAEPASAGTAKQRPGAAAPPDEGAVDVDAYLDQDDADAQLADDEQPGEQEGLLQQQQPPQQQAAAKQDSIPLPAAGLRRAAWLYRDLSVLLEDNYRAHTRQLLLSARACDVATAATLSDTRAACRVPYSSAAYLLATAERLGLPLNVTQPLMYCYVLPYAATDASADRLCEEFAPEMAYEGIVAGYNRHGARIYLLHHLYDAALLRVAGLSQHQQQR